mmetsp:Transcript_27760/g.92270  ORF Transcript_27760/g.92270 Transcript_27760/m.92270 type:complete len:310 (-) Transcript_27760:677-1606(-)
MRRVATLGPFPPRRPSTPTAPNSSTPTRRRRNSRCRPRRRRRPRCRRGAAARRTLKGPEAPASTRNWMSWGSTTTTTPRRRQHPEGGSLMIALLSGRPRRSYPREQHLLAVASRQTTIKEGKAKAESMFRLREQKRSCLRALHRLPDPVGRLASGTQTPTRGDSLAPPAPSRRSERLSPHRMPPHPRPAASPRRERRLPKRALGSSRRRSLPRRRPRPLRATAAPRPPPLLPPSRQPRWWCRAMWARCPCTARSPATSRRRPPSRRPRRPPSPRPRPQRTGRRRPWRRRHRCRRRGRGMAQKASRSRSS